MPIYVPMRLGKNRPHLTDWGKRLPGLNRKVAPSRPLPSERSAGWITWPITGTRRLSRSFVVPAPIYERHGKKLRPTGADHDAGVLDQSQPHRGSLLPLAIHCSITKSLGWWQNCAPPKRREIRWSSTIPRSFRNRCSLDSRSLVWKHSSQNISPLWSVFVPHCKKRSTDLKTDRKA